MRSADVLRRISSLLDRKDSNANASAPASCHAVNSRCGCSRESYKLSGTCGSFCLQFYCLGPKGLGGTFCPIFQGLRKGHAGRGEGAGVGGLGRRERRPNTARLLEPSPTACKSPKFFAGTSQEALQRQFQAWLPGHIQQGQLLIREPIKAMGYDTAVRP